MTIRRAGCWLAVLVIAVPLTLLLGLLVSSAFTGWPLDFAWFDR